MRWQRLLLTLLAFFFAVPVHGATITGPAFMNMSVPGQTTLRVGQIGNTLILKGQGGTTITTDRAGKAITISSPLAPAGRDGATWYSGSGEAATGLGKEGDFYFRTDTSSVYKKVSGLWGISIASLKGPSGSNGVGVPPGGLPGQVLGKASTANNDTVWIDPPAGSGGSGGVAGVSTIYGRSGAVWAQVGDYDTSQVPDTFNKRYVTDAQRTLLNGTSGVNTGNETTATIGNLVSGATAKAVPNDTDSFGVSDSSASNSLKKTYWSSIKAALRTYFDTLYHGMTVTWDEITGKPTLGTAASKDVGTAAGTVAAGNDGRFTDARTPTAHAATHAQGGSDPVTLSTAQVTGLDTALAGKQGALANAGTLAKVTESAGLPLWNGSAWPGGGESGGGDMFKAVYDPQGKNSDAFARANHTGNMSADNVTDGTTNKAYTATEKTKLAAITGNNTGDETTATIKSKMGPATNGADGYLTAADHAAFAAKQNALVAGVDYMAPSSSISGNAGSATKLQTARNINGVPFDGTQPITIYDSTKVPTTTTVNGKYLSASIALDKADVGLANVDNTADLAKPVSTATQAALNAKISSDSPTITGAANFTGTITASSITGPLTGNASTATKLQTARNINGIPFDGSAPITVADSTKVPITRTVNGKALSADIAITATDVGLPNADNTSDVSKPVSTATQAALDLKAPKDNPTFTTGITTPAVIPSSPDGTWRMNVRNSVPRSYTPQEGDMDTDAAGRIWLYTSGAWVEKGAPYTLPTASPTTLGGVKTGSTLTIANGVLDVMVSSLGPSGLVTAGLAGDQTISSGFAYVATATPWKATFNSYTSTKQTTVFANYSGTVCAASGSKLYWPNPVTFANNSGSCAKLRTGTRATVQMQGGKTLATATQNLQKASIPMASVSPTSLAFGNIVAGNTSSPLTATLTNSGLANLTTGTPTISGTDAAKFAISANGCSAATVTAGSTCTESVTFTPGTAGSYAAQLNIPHNAAGSPTVVALTGSSTTQSVLAITDNFARANQNPLRNGVNSSETPTGTWNSVAAVGGDAHIYNSPYLTVGGYTSLMYWAYDTFANNQYASLKQNAVAAGPAVRINTTTGDRYYLSISNSIVTLNRYSGGTTTPLQTYNVTMTTSKVYRLEVSGSTLTVKVDGVALSPTVTDSTLTSGQAGVYFGANSQIGTFAAGNL